jgi:hypothetical protein
MYQKYVILNLIDGRKQIVTHQLSLACLRHFYQLEITGNTAIMFGVYF